MKSCTDFRFDAGIFQEYPVDAQVVRDAQNKRSVLVTTGVGGNGRLMGEAIRHPLGIGST